MVESSDGDSAESYLPNTLRSAFLERARHLPVRSRQIVIAQGSDALGVFLICAGRIEISILSANGKELTLRQLESNEIFGELSALDHSQRSVNAVAIEDGLLALLSAEDFKKFLADTPGAALWLMRQMAMRIRSLTEKTFQLATYSVAGRVQAELLRLAALQREQGDRVEIPGLPTHAQLALRIGTHREAVSRELNQLTAEGLLRQRGRRLEILSLRGMRALHARIQG